MRVRVNGLGNLFQALISQCQLSVSKVGSVHGQCNICQVLGNQPLEGLVLNLLAALEGDVLLELVFGVLGDLDLLSGLGVDLL
jgi:hypothetical protein